MTLMYKRQVWQESYVNCLWVFLIIRNEKTGAVVATSAGSLSGRLK